MTLFQEAVRESIKLRIAVDGPTGGGKTWSSLQLGRILAGPNGKVALGDTENRTSLRYAPAPGEKVERQRYFDPPYRFDRVDLVAPYNPVALGEFINRAPDEIGVDGVLIIDSLTHYWSGEGGTLDIVDQAKLKGFNQFTAWQEGTPAQRYLLYCIIQCRCHIIVTMRSKMEYALEESTDSKGNRKSKVTKVGMHPEQRPGIEYEFDVIVSMDITNRAEITKSRIPGLMGTVFHPGRSFEIGEKLAEFAGSGAAPITDEQADALRDAIGSIPDEEGRALVRKEFVEHFGVRLSDLLDFRAEEAAEWVAAKVVEHSAKPKPEGALADALAGDAADVSAEAAELPGEAS